ncbi:MAG: hypothetical protein ACLPVO_01770 [Desulfomonilaceae bacterium]
MNLLWALLRTAGIAVVTVGGITFLMRKISPDSSDLVTSAIHFQKGLEEFQKGFCSIFCSSTGSRVEDLKKKQELTRIPIE